MAVVVYQNTVSAPLSLPTQSTLTVHMEPATVEWSNNGPLRIGGDSPDGLVLLDGVPVQRIVDVFTRDTVNNPPVLLHVKRVMSNPDGTYNLSGLFARAEGYDVCIRGIVANGERDVWFPGIQPG